MFIAHHILVPMDLTNLNRHALTVALQAIPADGEAATIHLVHSLRALEPALKRRIVSAPDESFVEDAIRADEVAMLEVLAAAQAEVAAPARPNLEVITHVVAVDLASACLALCDEVEVDVIVTGTHGRLGVPWRATVTERLVQDAPCSVVVVKPEGYPILRDCA